MYNRVIKISGRDVVFSINKDKGETYAIKKTKESFFKPTSSGNYALREREKKEIVKVTCDAIDNFDPVSGMALSFLKMLIESRDVELEGCPRTWGAFKRWARHEE